ncbi:MAG TPA: TIGR03943 family protein [Chroococcidiopsis sp.]
MDSRLRLPARPRSGKPKLPAVWLDIAAITAWGMLLLKYWITGKINILLHPDYVWLAIATGIFLLALGGLKTWQHWQQRSLRAATATAADGASPPLHISLLGPGVGSTMLLLVALVGLGFTPQPFASEVAMNRGVTDTLTMTRSQPQAFRSNTRPEDRAIIDWVRTLNVYPEPDAYAGQPVKVDGFAIHRSDLPTNYLMISRFVITCCAADVYPVGLPVKLTGDRSAYPADQWFRVEGSMITETLADQRQLVIEAKSLTPIPTPANPYEY